MLKTRCDGSSDEAFLCRVNGGHSVNRDFFAFGCFCLHVHIVQDLHLLTAVKNLTSSNLLG